MSQADAIASHRNALAIHMPALTLSGLVGLHTDAVGLPIPMLLLMGSEANPVCTHDSECKKVLEARQQGRLTLLQRSVQSFGAHPALLAPSEL